MQVLEHWTDMLWDPWLLGLFLLTGLYFSVRTGFFQLFGLPAWLRATVGSILRPTEGRPGRGISQWEALCTALASTIGTGSIAGVATAIWMGGPGAVFWMWISAILGMMTSFVEKMLAVEYRIRNSQGQWSGGPMCYLEKGMGSPLLAAIFSGVCLCGSLIGGNLVQSNSIASSLHAAFGWDRLAVGLATALASGLVMAGGIDRISKASALLVPVMALLYLGGGVAVMFLCRERILPALRLIVTGALCPQAAFGGSVGYTVSAAMRYGVARGVFTNEAGLGTAAMAHAAAEVDRPVRQGMWGILEVGVSTLLICTVTAMAILVSGVYDPALGALGLEPEGEVGAPMTAAAFSSVLGPVGGKVVALSLLLFAFSSILGWSFYGQQCLRYLSKSRRGERLYVGIFLMCVVWGSVWKGEAVWMLVDLCNGLMAIPNLAALILLSPQTFRALEQWGDESKRKNFRKKKKRLAFLEKAW